MMKRIFCGLLALVAMCGGALAQSSPGLVFGQVPTAGQWNSYFMAKQDVLGYTPVNKGGDVMVGPLITAPATTSLSGFNVATGVSPITPANGDIWETTDTVFARVNGATHGIAIESYLTSTAAVAGTNVATAQTWFPGGGPTTITVPASTTYLFTGKLSLSRSAGTTAHTIAILLGGTATLTSIDYVVHVTDQAATTPSLSTAQTLESTSAAATVITASSANAAQFNTIEVSGMLRVNATGTIIPQVQYSAAPGGAPTMSANNWFRMRPIGNGSVVSVGNWN